VYQSAQAIEAEFKEMNIFNLKSDEDWSRYPKSMVYLLAILCIGSAIAGGFLNNYWITRMGSILPLLILLISLLTNREYIINKRGKNTYLISTLFSSASIVFFIYLAYVQS